MPGREQGLAGAALTRSSSERSDAGDALADGQVTPKSRKPSISGSSPGLALALGAFTPHVSGKSTSESHSGYSSPHTSRRSDSQSSSNRNSATLEPTTPRAVRQPDRTPGTSPKSKRSRQFARRSSTGHVSPSKITDKHTPRISALTPVHNKPGSLLTSAEKLLLAADVSVSSDLPEVLVIGGGVAGCGAAIHLANSGFKVKIIERDTLFHGSSGRNPGRMGLGFHYIDKQTATMYLRATVKFVRAFPGFRIGEKEPWEHPYRHGRYFITKNSLFPREKILETYAELQKEYARLVAEDPANQVFGKPECFYRILERHEYENDVNMDEVIEGIETAEHLLDWPAFEEHLRDIISEQHNITVLEHCEVTELQRNMDTRFKVRAVHTIDKDGKPVKETVDFPTNYLINATWEHIEALNATMGIHMEEERTNRLKVLAEVDLPAELRDKHSMFFCMGPFAMFSNMGDGRGMMTFAVDTNHKESKALHLEDEIEALLRGQCQEGYKESIGNKIIAGVSHYIPEMADAKLRDVKFGIVQTRGDVDIFDPKSPFHRRNYYAVRAESVGLVSNPCMKLLYLLENADIVRATLLKHRSIDTAIQKSVDSILDTLGIVPQSSSHQSLSRALTSLYETYLVDYSVVEHDQHAGSFSIPGKVNVKVASSIKAKQTLHHEFMWKAPFIKTGQWKAYDGLHVIAENLAQWYSANKRHHKDTPHFEDHIIRILGQCGLHSAAHETQLLQQMLVLDHAFLLLKAAKPESTINPSMFLSSRPHTKRSHHVAYGGAGEESRDASNKRHRLAVTSLLTPGTLASLKKHFVACRDAYMKMVESPSEAVQTFINTSALMTYNRSYKRSASVENSDVAAAGKHITLISVR